MVLTKAQPPPSPAGSALTAACALSGQLPEAPFDPELVEFVANPQPFTEPFTNESLSIAARMIARVVGVHPVVFEILDDERRQPGASDTCQMLRIYSVDARLRSVLLELRFGDLVEATLAAMEGGISRMILSKVERIHGEPAYFHERPADGGCSNRVGTLVAYRKHSGETLIVRKDGSIYYNDARSSVFDRHRLEQEDLARLMQSFQSAGFDGFPSSLPPIDNTQGRPSITLVCARYQRVLIPGRESLLAPVLAALEEVKTKALSGSYYLLRYNERREITFLDWPFSKLPLDQIESMKRTAYSQEAEARASGRTVPKTSEGIHQELPAEYLAKLPGVWYLGASVRDPNRDVYVRQESKIFRVVKQCPSENCGTFGSLIVVELKTPDSLLSAIPASGAADDSVSYTRLSGAIYGMLWPPGTGIGLHEVPPEGQRISNEDFAKHALLYRELYAAGTPGLSFIEGRYFYTGVRIARREAETQPNAPASVR
ncbi:MAG: hypothetical protein WAJ87_22270 [Bryobacteraceae bacterium]